MYMCLLPGGRMDSSLLVAAAEALSASQWNNADTCIGLMCRVSDSVISTRKIKMVAREQAT